jgi:hypothetical protein
VAVVLRIFKKIAGRLGAAEQEQMEAVVPEFHPSIHLSISERAVRAVPN